MDSKNYPLRCPKSPFYSAQKPLLFWCLPRARDTCILIALALVLYGFALVAAMSC